MIRRLALLVCSLLFAGVVYAQTSTTSAEQAVLSYSATNATPCSIEVSTTAVTYTPLAYPVDAAKFSNANSDGLSNVGARQFVVGQKWVGTESANVPASITVTPGQASRTAKVTSQGIVTGGNLVTVTGPTHPFVYGDYITVTSSGNNDPYAIGWAKVWKVNSSTSFAYQVVTVGPDTNANTLTITRANRYSLALQTNTTYYYRIGNSIISGGSACVASPLTGTFTTMNVPNGTAWQEGPVTDNNGSELFPSMPESRPGASCPANYSGYPLSCSVIDPLTGVPVSRLSLYSDTNSMTNGGSSGFFRVCNTAASANGYFHCHSSVGNGSNAGVWSVKPGNFHWLGFGTWHWVDNLGATYHGVTSGDSSGVSMTSSTIYYSNGLTHGASQPNKNVLVSYAIPGTVNDSVDQAAGYSWDAAATALTPDATNQTLDDKLAAFDSKFIPNHFHGCALVEATKSAASTDILTGYCRFANQSSPTWWWAFDVNSATLLGAVPTYAHPHCRWCGAHGLTVIASQKWAGAGVTMMTGSQEGLWELTLVNAVTSGSTAMTVTAPQWRANTTTKNGEQIYDFGMGFVDTNGNLEVQTSCNNSTSCGTTGATAPTWNTNTGGTTVDNNITWTNEGPIPAGSANEPHNIFPRNDVSNGSGYWSYLQAVAGGAGGGLATGDVFTFTDGTFECVRVVSISSSGNWATVQRGVYYPGSYYCSSPTAQAHAAGARLMAVCENQESLTGDNFFWDFIDDPHGTDTTNTTFAKFQHNVGHGYLREPAPSGWNSGQLFFWHNPFIAADFGAPINVNLAMDIPFAGYTASTAGSAHNDYTNWDSEAASSQTCSPVTNWCSAFTTNTMFGGGGSTGYGSFAKVTGTTSIYKFITPVTGNGPRPVTMQVPLNSLQGPNTIKDISGPGSALTDASTTPASCYVVVAGECWTGSAVGEAYANLPTVYSACSSAVPCFCSPGGENSAFEGHDWCYFNQPTRGDSMLQVDLLMANSLPVPGPWCSYTPCSGFGLSRTLARTLVGGLKSQNSNYLHQIPDGNGDIFLSCVADPTIIYDIGSDTTGTPQTHATNETSNLYGCQTYYVQVPPQPTADGLDRSDYLTVPITVGAVGASPTYAILEYGYEENEPTRAVTRPPTIHYYCTQYHGACYWSGSAKTPAYSTVIPGPATQLGLSQTQNLKIGVPQRILAYNILYFNASNTQVGSSGLQFLSVDSVAIGGPSVSFLGGPVSFANTNVGSSSSPTTVTVTNTGSANLVLGAGAVTLSGTNPGDFSISSDNCSSHTVTPSSTCTFAVTFTPTVGGSRTASVVVTGNASGSNTLSGTGVASGSPSVSMTPTPLAFGNVNVGSGSTMSVTVTNTGTASLVMGAGAVTFSGTNASDLSLSNDLCSSHTVTVNSTCTFSVTFTPAASGSRTATITVTGNASGTNSVTGTGVTIAPIIAITPNPASFGNVNVGGSSAPLTFTVTNSGNANEVIGANAISFSGTNSSDFSVATDNCSNQTVAFPPSVNTCTFSVTFSPSAVGSRTATVKVTGTASANDTLNGTGIATSPALGLTPGSPLNFGVVAVGSSSSSTTVTVTNTGNGNLILTANGQIASDSFNRASLGSNWTATDGTFSINASTAVQVATVGADSYAAMYWNANAAPNNGFVELTLTTIGSNACGSVVAPAYRMSASAATFYALEPCNNKLYILRRINGSSLFATSVAYTPTAGDVLRLSVIGTSLVGYVNGVSKVTYTDSQIASGSAGIMGNISGTSWLATPWDFGSGSSPAITITGTNPTDFNFSNDTCTGNTLTPSQTCTFSVTFSPTVSGSRTATLTVLDQTDNVTGTLTLNGTGTSGSAGGTALGGTVKSNGTTVVQP